MPTRTVVSPSTDSSTNQTHVPNPEYETWKSHDRVILLWIKTTIDSSILGHIIQSQTTAEAWTSLHHIFQTQSLARVMTLRLQLQTMTKGSLSIMEYVQRKRTISNNLDVALQPVTNELVTYILYVLDPSYAPSARPSTFELLLSLVTNFLVFFYRKNKNLLMNLPMSLFHLILSIAKVFSLDILITSTQ